MIQRMAPTRSCWNAMLALALGLLALAAARAQAPLTGDLALWTDASHPVLSPPTAACDDAGVCAAFWTISEDPQNSHVDLLGSVVSPGGVTALTLLQHGGFIADPVAVGMAEGFAVFYDSSSPISGSFLQFVGEDLSPAGPPILLPAGPSSVVRTPEGFALLGYSVPRRGSGTYLSLAFIDTDGRLLRPPVQMSAPALVFGLGLAVQPGGSLVAVYSLLPPLSRSGCSQVFVRRIGSSGRLFGRLLGPAVAVADRSCLQNYPAVGVAADGTFIVTWASGTPNSPAAIVAERFSAQGRPLGRLFGISQSVPSALLPVVSVDPNGHYFVVWESNDPNDAVHDIRGRWLEADGAPITPELTLNEAQDELDHLDQGTPQVAVGTGGFMLVTWQSIVPGNFNPPASSVARWFTPPP
jgi:hypothetical protein